MNTGRTRSPIAALAAAVGRAFGGWAFVGTALAGCGGTVVFEDEGTGGAASGPTSVVVSASSSVAVSGSSSVVVSASSGAGGCAEHDDCAAEQLCIFATGACAPACQVDRCDSCGRGRVCEECATSSCPGCRDCAAACVPAAGRCDDDDPCPEGSICHFGEGRCAAGCTDDGACADPDDVCAPCESTPCCACSSCVDGCIAPRD